ncbi:MAG TPA: class I SAM-dependent methyltransferase [Acidimicrobiales bacterium]|nr:class I SAM-dependent methyltransferase [Acidimicrobiales bacterium]
MEPEEAGQRWADALAAWAIPDEILAGAPAPPWGFPPEPFAHAARRALAEAHDTPSRQRAREALSPSGTVLDVAAGAGAASLPLATLATHITAVDESPDMLDMFSELASKLPVPHSVVAGRWPDVAQSVAQADVVVCHHVVYNVSDIVGFLSELGRHARRRVVVEMTEAHPLSNLNAAWRAIHGIDRPEAPGADDLVAVLRALGLQVQLERFSRPLAWADDAANRVALARRRLCVGPERDAEIARVLPAEPRHLVTLWWDAGRGAHGVAPDI